MIKDGTIHRVDVLGLNETIVVDGRLFLVSRGHDGGVAICELGQYEGPTLKREKLSEIKSISDWAKEQERKYNNAANHTKVGL